MAPPPYYHVFTDKNPNDPNHEWYGDLDSALETAKMWVLEDPFIIRSVYFDREYAFRSGDLIWIDGVFLD